MRPPRAVNKFFYEPDRHNQWHPPGVVCLGQRINEKEGTKTERISVVSLGTPRVILPHGSPRSKAKRDIENKKILRLKKIESRLSGESVTASERVD